MTNIVGIIPAGGAAGRFHGMEKEFLPISENECGLTRCICSMQNGGADEIIVITRSDKFSRHWQMVEAAQNVRLNSRIFKGLWEVLAFFGSSSSADWMYFAMPDTVYPVNIFNHPKNHDVICGTFQTDKPSRFGILAGNRIVDKSPNLIGEAWGTWIWSRAAMRFLADMCLEKRDHTAALNELIGHFGVETFSMDYYFDFASFADYKEFLCFPTSNLTA